MHIKTHPHIDDMPPTAWNALTGTDNPFLRHEFLAALERQACVGPGTAWQPCHVAAWDGDRLAGALPMYVKYDSWGEFVFDWSWAHAYAHAGRRYYPKLVAAVPYTPVTGRRLLIRSDEPRPEAVAHTLIAHALELAARQQLSSLHVLFNAADDAALLTRHNLIERTGFQYHWHNHAYRDFADFLDTFVSKKRKNVLRDRRLVREAGVECTVLTGREIDATQWRTCYRFYAATMRRKGNVAALSESFFRELGATMPDHVMLVMARRGRDTVGGAFFLRDEDHLYGRYWGCDSAIPGLHFEVCYYRPIEYCVAHGLQRFEAGAQGEHKIDRGFVPVETRSAHWIADPVFRRMIEDSVRHERRAIAHQIEQARMLTPYKQPSSWASTSNAATTLRHRTG